MKLKGTTIAFISDPQLTAGCHQDIEYSHRVVNWLNNIENVPWPEGTLFQGQPIGDISGVFVCGDLTMEGGYPNIFFHSSLFTTFREIYEHGFEKNSLKWPVFMGLGNHDIKNASGAVEFFTGKDALRMFMWLYICKLYVGNDKTEPKYNISSCDAQKQPDYMDAQWQWYSYNYSVDFPDLHVIQLHNYYDDVEYGRASGNNWLVEDLKNTGKSKPIVIVQHMGWNGHPGWNNGNPDEKGYKPFTQWPNQTADALLKALEGYNVIAVLRGHDHGCLGKQSITYSTGEQVQFSEYIPGSTCFNTNGGKSPSSIDAIVSSASWPYGHKAYFFKDDQYIRWDVDSDKFDFGPRRIRDGWPGLPEAFNQGIDAAVASDYWPYGQKAYFFKGDQYVRWDIRKDKLDHGPRLIKDGWPGLPEEFHKDLDAVMAASRWPYGDGKKCYFFKGSKYVRWDIDKDKIDGHPREISDGWAGLPHNYYQGIGTAVADDLWPVGSKAYFFKDGKYVRWDIPSDKLDQEERDIKEYWPGIFEVENGGFAGILGQSDEGFSIAIGWINYHGQMEWKHIYQEEYMLQPKDSTGNATSNSSQVITE